MSIDNSPQFFTSDARGESVGVPAKLIDNSESLIYSQIRARNTQPNTQDVSTHNLDGIPGIPPEHGQPNPDSFFQGEDIVYDLFLYHDGAPVTTEDYTVSVAIKTSPRAKNIIWQGNSSGDSILPQPGQPGYYELWIPAYQTAAFMAGTYYLHVMIQEKTAGGKGRYDRKHVLLQSYFNVDYSNFSENTESASGPPKRVAVDATWPNKPNTIGAGPLVNDSFFLNQGI
jgi:hypothetical protein